MRQRCWKFCLPFIKLINRSLAASLAWHRVFLSRNRESWNNWWLVVDKKNNAHFWCHHVADFIIIMLRCISAIIVNIYKFSNCLIYTPCSIKKAVNILGAVISWNPASCLWVIDFYSLVTVKWIGGRWIQFFTSFCTDRIYTIRMRMKTFSFSICDLSTENVSHCYYWCCSAPHWLICWACLVTLESKRRTCIWIL